MTATAGDGLPASEEAIAGAWTVLYEDLIAGIIHSMNNSVTVLAVSLELSSPEDVQGDVTALQRELSQLVSLIGLTSVLSGRSIRPEALELRDVLDLAVTIHALSAVTRAVTCVVRVSGVVPPVRVPRTALLRVLLLMIDGAKRARGADSTSVTLEVTGDQESVVVRAPSGTLGADALGLATLCGGTLVVEDGSIVFALPSLLRLRRASRAEVPLRDGARPTRATGS